jgi:hypothetical protein
MPWTSSSSALGRATGLSSGRPKRRRSGRSETRVKRGKAKCHSADANRDAVNRGPLLLLRPQRERTPPQSHHRAFLAQTTRARFLQL